MALSLSELVRARSKDEFRALFLAALQGIGFIAKTGTGTGSLGASGNPTVAASVVVELLGAGELGVATFRYSLDGGVTWAGTGILVPANGSYAMAGTGVTLKFAIGPAGSGTSFKVGDRYAFALSAPNFPVTAWQPFSVPLTLVELQAEAMEDFGETQLAIAAGGLLDYSTGDWLTLLASNVYGLTRKPAVRTRGFATLTDAANAGPFNIAVGQLWAVSSSGKRFTNVTGGVLALGGTLQIQWDAEQAGSAYNVANNSITALATPLPGVTINNPDPGSGTWVTQQGTDEENDAALAQRCRERWSTLGITANADGYASWAKAASLNVTRVKVRLSPSAEGTVEVFLAGPSGGSDGATVTAVDAYIQQRVPLTSSAVVQAATNTDVTVQGTVYVEAAQLAAAQIAVDANLEALFGAIDIGGTVHVAEIIEQVMIVTGVKNYVPVLPAADVVLASDHVATLTLALTWVGV